MSEILKAAETLQQMSQDQSKAIKQTATKDFRELRQHLKKQIKQSEEQISNDMDDMVSKIQQNQTNTVYSALTVFLIGLIFGAILVVGILFAIQKLNIQV